MSKARRYLLLVEALVLFSGGVTVKVTNETTLLSINLTTASSSWNQATSNYSVNGTTAGQLTEYIRADITEVDETMEICPRLCDCNYTISEVDCQNAVLIAPPENISALVTSLIMSHNLIKSVNQSAYSSFTNLQLLNLSNNVLRDIEKYAFMGLTQLKILDLSSNEIVEIKADHFTGLVELSTLFLSFNKLRKIQSGTFSSLTMLEHLFLHRNPMFTYPKEMLKNSTFLLTLSSDDHMLCCASGTPLESCTAETTVLSFSRCSDILYNDIARVFIWLIAFFTCFGNLFVIVVRVVRQELRKAPAIFTMNLALADLLMSVYLFIIASADSYYRGEFYHHLQTWRVSSACKAAGAIFTLSAEVSIMTLALITIERVLVIGRPEIGIRLSTSPAKAYAICASLWVVGIIIAVMPFLPAGYFGGEFYARSTVCLPLHLAHTRLPGWEYAIAIFLGLNLASLVTVVLGYLSVFVVVKRNAKSDMVNIYIARKMTALVIVDCCCWLPIFVLHFMALSAEIPEVPQIYSWLALFVLPLNPALNPIVYTLSACTGSKHTMPPESREHATLNRMNSRSECLTISGSSPGPKVSVNPDTGTVENLVFVERRGPLDRALDDGVRLCLADIHTLMLELNNYMKEMRKAGVQSFTVNETTVVVEQTRDSNGKMDLHFWLQSDEEGDSMRHREFCALDREISHEHAYRYDDSAVQLTDLVSRLMRKMNYKS